MNKPNEYRVLENFREGSNIFKIDEVVSDHYFRPEKLQFLIEEGFLVKEVHDGIEHGEAESGEIEHG